MAGWNGAEQRLHRKFRVVRTWQNKRPAGIDGRCFARALPGSALITVCTVQEAVLSVGFLIGDPEKMKAALNTVADVGIKFREEPDSMFI